MQLRSVVYTIKAAMDLALHSYLAGWDGANAWARVDGVDVAPAALAAVASPTGSCFIGGGSATPLFPLDGSLGLVAVAKRSFALADKNEWSAISLAGWGI